MNRYLKLADALYFDTRTEFVRHFLSGRSGIKLLDVGNLGEGVVNVDIRKIITENGGEYFGLDVNENLARDKGYENQLIGDLHDLKDIEDGTFDCMYAGQIIEHTWRPAEMIKECHRVLKPDGILILDTPNIYDFTNLARYFGKRKDTLSFDVNILTYNEARDNFDTLRNKEKALLSQPQHKILFSPAMLRQLLNMHGFLMDPLVFIGKPRNIFHKLLLRVFPQASQKLGVRARKASLEEIFEI